MSTEYKPVSAIRFSSIDNRLAKYGLKVEMSGHATALSGRNGVLFAKPEGDSTNFERKLGVDTEDVFEAIQTEYGGGDARWGRFSNRFQLWPLRSVGCD